MADRLEERLLRDVLGDFDVPARTGIDVAVYPIDRMVVPRAERPRIAECFRELTAPVLGRSDGSYVGSLFVTSQLNLPPTLDAGSNRKPS
jgi:hypothetical protein